MPLVDNQGSFILELDNKDGELFVMGSPSMMCCPSGSSRTRMMVGKVRCDVAGPDAMPDALRKQARVQKLLRHRYEIAMRERAVGVTGVAR